MTIVENRRDRAHFDWPLTLMVFGLCIFGILAITVATFSAGSDSSASLLNHIMESSSAQRQCLFVGVVAPLVIVVLIHIPYQFLRRYTMHLYVLGNLLLFFTWILNRAAGVKAWLDVIWGFTIQPSELIKFAIILSTAQALCHDEQPLTSIESWIRIFGLIAIPAAIIVLSGEMGSLLVIIFMVAVMFYFGKVPIRMLLILAALAIASVLVIYALVTTFDPDSYRLARILAFLNPDLYSSTDAYQQTQSQMAIGAGGLSGIGIFVDGSLSQLNYVPADWTDFIFSTIGEAWGFIGCITILAVYLAIILRMMYLARHTRDRFGMLVIYGVVGMLLFHVFENVGMTLGLMPITGIPLPFLSYGGSNMVTNMGGIALVLNVTMNRSLTHTVITPQRKHNSYLAGHDR